MLELPGKMQATLVSHYGEKSSELSDLLRESQHILVRCLGSSFRPHQLQQVHGTIIGLEGHRSETKIRNQNSAEAGIVSEVEPSALLRFLRGPEFPSIRVRIGGYRYDQHYPFTSRGMHPYLRSFSIQGEIAVAMGWPVVGSDFPTSLDGLRWQFDSSLGVRHKWHRKRDDTDNDFFLALGRVDHRFLNATRIQHASEQVRLFFAGLDGIIVPVGIDTMKIVGYLESQLPLETSCWFEVKDSRLTPERLLGLYPPLAKTPVTIR
jgi:hypothetical protein